jgi:hypothetical protein
MVNGHRLSDKWLRLSSEGIVSAGRHSLAIGAERPGLQLRAGGSVTKPLSGAFPRDLDQQIQELLDVFT